MKFVPQKLFNDSCMKSCTGAMSDPIENCTESQAKSRIENCIGCHVGPYRELHRQPYREKQIFLRIFRVQAIIIFVECDEAL